MRNLALLLDTNVVMNYILERPNGFEDAQFLFDCCQKGTINGYLAFHSVSIIWYALRKKPVDERRSVLLRICKLLTVIGASHHDVVQAILNDDFKDFEDCLQEKCAVAAGADYIVTENKKDFFLSVIPAVTTHEMRLILKEQE